jgi:hypothetical protein
MSKKTDELLPEDFGKSFDGEVFDNWKKSVREHEQASITMLIFYGIGFLALVMLGGFVGLILFFGLSFIGLGICLPKQGKRKKYQQQLGIVNRDIQNAIVAAKKRLNEVQ